MWIIHVMERLKKRCLVTEAVPICLFLHMTCSEAPGLKTIGIQSDRRRRTLQRMSLVVLQRRKQKCHTNERCYIVWKPSQNVSGQEASWQESQTTWQVISGPLSTHVDGNPERRAGPATCMDTTASQFPGIWNEFSASKAMIAPIFP